MSDILQFEQRIAAAFDRMDQGLETLARSKPAAQDAQNAGADLGLGDLGLGPISEPAPQMAALLRALELAKASSADWADRYRALESQMNAETMAMASEIARLTGEVEAAQNVLAALPAPASSDALPERDAEIDELAARLALQETELEHLRALRADEADELDQIIAALSPLVEETAHV